MKELIPFFQKHFSKNRKTYGIVGTPVKFRIVPNNDFKAEVEKEAQRLADSTLHLHLKFAPDRVRDNLQRFYKAMQQPFPARLRTIDENTKLTRDEQAALFTLVRVLTVAKAKAEADKIGGFYSPIAREIVFRDIQIDAGTVAHEMAHAYAGPAWFDFIHMMRLRGMEDTDKLDEGMATYIERIVVDQWFAKQPSNATIPTAGYDSTYTGRANEFVKALGKDVAYEAYFGGRINFTDNNKPEDSLVFGKRRSKWKWPWRKSLPAIPHLHWVFK